MGVENLWGTLHHPTIRINAIMCHLYLLYLLRFCAIAYHFVQDRLYTVQKCAISIIVIKKGIKSYSC